MIPEEKQSFMRSEAQLSRCFYGIYENQKTGLQNMKKQEVYDYLASKGVEYEVTEHEAIFNVEELQAAKLPHPEAQAKNLFVRDDKKRHY